MNFSYIKSDRTSYSHPQKESFFMHTHDDYEIFCFLEGDAQYNVEGNIYPLKPGDIILMRKSESHNLMLRSSVSYKRITVNFSVPLAEESGENSKMLDVFNNRNLGKYNRYPTSLFSDKNWLYYLESICENNDHYTKSIYLSVLLKELSDSFDKVKLHRGATEDSSLQILHYINRHLTEPLSLERICKRFFLSKSQLNRNFKRSNGSTVWEYITAKRLLLAKEYLQNGVKPTETYKICGFDDYVTFYRAYKKRFGSSPKKDYGNN